MEYIGVLLKAILTLAVTLVYNKFMSMFRVRHLYCTFHTVLNNYDRGEIGSTTVLVLGNVGKDKEKSIVLSFPKNKKCRLISRDYSGITVNGNTLKVDRILPRQKITATIFLSGDKPQRKINVPQLRSEDASGKVYFGYGHEPVNAGPLFIVVSFIAAFFSVMYYSTLKDGDPFAYYRELRYWDFYRDGFLVRNISDNFLISDLKPISADYPVKFKAVVGDSDLVSMVFYFKNIAEYDVNLSARFEYPPGSYYDESMDLYEDHDLTSDELDSRRLELERKYKIVPSELMLDGVKVKSEQGYEFKISRPNVEGLSLKDFEVFLDIKGQGTAVDRYMFKPQMNADASKKLAELLAE
ncbi:hypothetical protein [Stutzerimonas stutzeri]|uniref:hypothetical protein n=1 Tax=Stutzerimonas stutzeri TaxID=316 RepID=UPI0015E36B33|nr:hypothetical protein [Stutzerimonas stutzeri]MBA1225037.1 hypothetical protein [Stutzerimonas stutzeri]